MTVDWTLYHLLPIFFWIKYLGVVNEFNTIDFTLQLFNFIFRAAIWSILTVTKFYWEGSLITTLWIFIYQFFRIFEADGGFLLCPAPQILFYFLLLWTWYGQNSMQLNSTQCTSEFHVIGISTFYFGFPPTSFTPFNERNPIKSYLIS